MNGVTIATFIAAGITAVSIIVGFVTYLVTRRGAINREVGEQARLLNDSLYNKFFLAGKSKPSANSAYTVLAQGKKWTNNNYAKKATSDNFDSFVFMFFDRMNLLYNAYLRRRYISKRQLDGYRRVVNYVYKPLFLRYEEFEMMRKLVTEDAHFDLWQLDFKDWLNDKLLFNLDDPSFKPSRKIRKFDPWRTKILRIVAKILNVC